MVATPDITAQELDELIAEHAAAWVDSERFEALLRDARADAALLRELDELLPDTIADL